MLELNEKRLLIGFMCTGECGRECMLLETQSRELRARQQDCHQCQTSVESAKSGVVVVVVCSLLVCTERDRERIEERERRGGRRGVWRIGRRVFCAIRWHLLGWAVCL